MARSSANLPIENPSKEFVASIEPHKVLRILVSIALFLGIASGIGRLLDVFVFIEVLENSVLWRLLTLFDVDYEANFPTYYSSLLLLLSSLLLMYIASATKADRGKYHTHWLGLAATFLFLATDEILQLHEMLIEPLRAILDTSGFLFYAWVIPYAFLLLLVGLLYLRFLAYLPKRIRNLFLLSGAVYVGGALGFEMIVGYIMTSNIVTDTRTLYALTTLSLHLEELLEMLGTALFIYSLILYIGSKYAKISVRVTHPDLPPRVGPL